MLVVVPTYNNSEFVQKAIKSIQAQTCTDWVCVVVNDGSIDDTEQSIVGAIKGDDRFTLLNQSNQGAAAARNNGFTQGCQILGRTPIRVTYLDSDDCLVDDAMNYLLGLPTPIACGLARVIDKNGNLLANSPDIPFSFGQQQRVGYPFGFDDICQGWPVVNVAQMMFDGTFIKEVGGFDEDIHTVEDLDFYLKCAALGATFTFYPQIVMEYRRHANQCIAGHKMNAWKEIIRGRMPSYRNTN